MTGQVWLARGEEWEIWSTGAVDWWWEVADGDFVAELPDGARRFYKGHPKTWMPRILIPVEYRRLERFDEEAALEVPRVVALELEWRGRVEGGYPLLEEVK